MNNFLKSEKKDAKEIFRRFNKRDFSGDTGQAVKNSTYQLAENIIAKVGSLIFTVILARILMPELFGLYSLTLSTIILFSSFSDFGIISALMTFIPKEVKKNNLGKANAYVKKLWKWKLIILTTISIILALSSFFVANYYYQKPIFLALLAGILYIIFSGVLAFMEGLFRVNNDFKKPMYKEIVFQVSRFILLPLFLIAFISRSSPAVIAMLVILALSFCYLITIIYLIPPLKKIKYLKAKIENVTSKENKDLLKFLLPLSATVLSGIFFGYIDTIMLGHYVPSEFISDHGVAFALIGSLTPIISFSATALFPLFSGIEGQRLEKLFKKALSVTILLSIVGSILTFFFSSLAIKLIYGSSYLTAVPILKILSILIILLPISAIYDTYFISQRKTKTIAILLVLSTILNIILNFIGINYGLNHFGPLGAIVGASIATIASRFFYLFWEIIFYQISKTKSF